MKGKLLAKMLILAVNSHAEQFDKGGNPYILHPLKVMHYLDSDDEELQCIALGHDLVEDCKNVTYNLLKELGFSDRIIAGIRGLTKVPGETHKEYLERVKQNPDCVKVKLCDLRHNHDIRRLKGLTDKDFARMKRYAEDFAELKNV